MVSNIMQKRKLAVNVSFFVVKRAGRKEAKSVSFWLGIMKGHSKKAVLLLSMFYYEG